MFSQPYNDEYRGYHEATMLEPQEDFNYYANSTGSGLIYNVSMKLLNDEDSSDNYFQERYSFNPELHNWRSPRKTSTALSTEENASCKLEAISPDGGSEDGSAPLRDCQSCGQHFYSQAVKNGCKYKNSSSLVDQGYHSCSSPEIVANELFSDLEDLSFEELRAFPAMSAMEVDFLYQEQRRLGQSAVGGARPCFISTLLFPRRIRQQRKIGTVRRTGGSCTKSSNTASTNANKQHQLLWQFLYAAASEPRFKEAIEMEDDGRHDTFAIKDKRRFEEAWATFKGSAKKVPYEYITRNMRHLYRSPHHFLSKVVGQQHKYRFLFHNIEHCYGPNWRHAVAIAARNLLPDSTSSSLIDLSQEQGEQSRQPSPTAMDCSDARRNSFDTSDENL